jgi:hypothetical protein
LVLSGPKDIITFGAGAPNSQTFPIESIEITTKFNTKFTLDGSVLNTALQYGSSEGCVMRRSLSLLIFLLFSQAELVLWLHKLQTHLHSPPTSKYNDERKCEIIVVPGSQDGLCKVCITKKVQLY